MDKNKIPVLIGVGQLTNREKTTDQLDPIKMMAEASRIASGDATLDNLSKVDTLYVVNCLSRSFENPFEELSEELDCTLQRQDTQE